MSHILIIDDERGIRNTLKDILEYEKYKVDDAENGKIGLEKFKKNSYHLVLCDIKMPEMDGMEVLHQILSLNPEIPVVMISGHATIETAVDAVKKGAYDFLAKPLDLNRVLITVRNALDREQLIQENTNLKKKISSKVSIPIIGESAKIQDIKDLIEKVAPTDARVLITGKNGSGKELVARQLHEKSKRKEAPYVEVNCAAIPSELIESELFGHEKGAFTSAIKTKAGRFEQAQGGTLFLDEIGDMSLSAQAKVLRALQENKITRVGAEKDIAVDVRILAATNKNLKEEIEKGNFREDLYHRLSVILIHVPSLNDRKDDIPRLADHFLNLIAQEYGTPVKKIDKKAMLLLQQKDWSGNIRELRNSIERLVILADNPVTEEDIKKYILGNF